MNNCAVVAIAFIQKKENMDFPEAVRHLASKHHISHILKILTLVSTM